MIFSKLSSLFTRMSSSPCLPLRVFLLCLSQKARYGMLWILNDIEWWSLRWSRVRADDWAVEVCRSRSWLLQRAVQAWVRGWRPVPESTSSKSCKQPQQKGKHDPHPILSVFLSVCFYMNLCFSTYLRYILEYLKCWWPNIKNSFGGGGTDPAKRKILNLNGL